MKKLHISMINLWCNKNLVDSQLFLWKLLSENPDSIEYYSDPYEKWVELVILNTCSFISSGREEMFQTVEKLLSKKKKVCIIWCGVQYFEKLLKSSRTTLSVANGEVKDPDNTPMDSSLCSEWQTNSEIKETFAITSENLPFSKMKQLMTIVSWNPWDITIQVLWNEMKVSEKWLNELKKLIKE